MVVSMPKSQKRTSMLYDALTMPTNVPLFSDDFRVWTYIGQAMVERRAELGLTQTEAAKLVGLGLTSWSQLEQAAKDNIRNGTATKLCRFLGWKPTAIHDLILSGEVPKEQTSNDSFSITWNEYETIIETMQKQEKRITDLEKKFNKVFR